MRYQSAIDDGLDEDAVCSLERPAEAENLSAAERSALHFAELFATNHLAIDDAVYDELRQHFSEDELVELGVNCAIALGIGRLSATWDVSDDLPASSAPVVWADGALEFRVGGRVGIGPQLRASAVAASGFWAGVGQGAGLGRCRTRCGHQNHLPISAAMDGVISERTIKVSKSNPRPIVVPT